MSQACNSDNQLQQKGGEEDGNHTQDKIENDSNQKDVIESSVTGESREEEPSFVLMVSDDDQHGGEDTDNSPREEKSDGTDNGTGGTDNGKGGTDNGTDGTDNDGIRATDTNSGDGRNDTSLTVAAEDHDKDAQSVTTAVGEDIYKDSNTNANNSASAIENERQLTECRKTVSGNTNANNSANTIRGTVSCGAPTSDGMQPMGSGSQESDEAEKDMLQAVIEVEGSLKGDAESRKTDTSVSSPTKFTQVNCLRLRNQLFEALEELRIRRSMDKENEEKIKQLVTEKHHLENKQEEATRKVHDLEEGQTDRVQQVEKKHTTKLKQIQEDKAKLQSNQEASEKELKALKDEVRALQLTKYTLEKKLREQEQKLQLQNLGKDSNLAQIAELEERCQGLSKKLTELVEQQARLEQNVKEANRLNHKLMYINQHQQCEMKGYKQDVSRLHEELVTTKVQVDNRPVISHDELTRNKQEISSLQQQLEASKLLVRDLQKQFAEIKMEKEETAVSLRDAHDLIDRHVESCAKSTQMAEEYKAGLEKMTGQYDEIKVQFDEAQKQQEIEKETYKKATEEWKLKEESLSSRLHTLQADYESLTKTHGELEELNSRWAEKNLQLSEQVKQLKEELHKPRVDAEVQTEQKQDDKATETDAVETTSSGVQCESPVMARQDHASQTEPEINLKERSPSECVTGSKADTLPLKDSTDSSAASAQETSTNRKTSTTCSKDDMNKSSKSDTTAAADDRVCSSPILSCSQPLTGYPADHDMSESFLSSSQPLPGTACAGSKAQVHSIVNRSDPTAAKSSDPGELSPYSRFSATLRNLRSSSKPSQTAQSCQPPSESMKKDERRHCTKNQTTEAASKSPQLSLKRKPETMELRQTQHVDDGYVGKSPSRYTFQFTHVPQTNLVTEDPYIKCMTSTLPDGTGSVPVSILQDPGAPRPKKSKKVHFAKDVETPNNPVPSVGSAFRVIGNPTAPVVPIIHQPEINDTVLSGEEPLFSEDENDEFDLGSQVDRISHFLATDRLRTTKKSQPLHEQ